jgi:hypothetical protein
MADTYEYQLSYMMKLSLEEASFDYSGLTRAEHRFPFILPICNSLKP